MTRRGRSLINQPRAAMSRTQWIVEQYSYLIPELQTCSLTHSEELKKKKKTPPAGSLLSLQGNTLEDVDVDNKLGVH